ncbi:MAG: ATP-dependent Clp protease adaptor ClpS [Pseudomonadota bacterium]
MGRTITGVASRPGCWAFDPEKDAPEVGDDVRKLLDQVADPEKALEDVYAVVLHNDDLNGMEFVVRVIRTVFGYGISRSTLLMLRVHFSGRAMLWTGQREAAEDRRRRIEAFGPDPQGRPGAATLTVSVERVF